MPMSPTIDREHPDRLNGIRIQVRTVGVGQLGERLDIVTIAVLVGHPGHRHEPRLGVDPRLEDLGRRRPVRQSLGRPHLDAGRACQMLIEHEAARVVEIVNDDVVTRLKTQGRRHDVLAFSRREEKSDLIRLGADQTRVLPAHLLTLLEHRTERHRADRLRLDETLSCLLHHLPRHRRDIGRVQVDAVSRHREIGPHPQRIVIRLHRSHSASRSRQDRRPAGRLQELSPIDVHT